MQKVENISKGAALVRKLLAHDDRRSEIFTYVVFAAAPIAGSVASVVVNVGAAGGLLEILRGVTGFGRDRFLLYLTVPLYLYCAAYLLSLAINPAPDWGLVLPC